MATELDAAELLLLRAAWLEDNGRFRKGVGHVQIFCLGCRHEGGN